MLGLLPNKFACFFRLAHLAPVMVFLLGSFAHAQRLQDMPLRYIVEKTEALIAENKFAEVAPFLTELEDRFSDTKDKKIMAVLQKFGFIRGVAFLQVFSKSNDKGII